MFSDLQKVNNATGCTLEIYLEIEIQKQHSSASLARSILNRITLGTIHNCHLLNCCLIVQIL